MPELDVCLYERSPGGYQIGKTIVAQLVQLQRSIYC